MAVPTIGQCGVQIPVSEVTSRICISAGGRQATFPRGLMLYSSSNDAIGRKSRSFSLSASLTLRVDRVGLVPSLHIQVYLSYRVIVDGCS